LQPIWCWCSTNVPKGQHKNGLRWWVPLHVSLYHCEIKQVWVII
jgi:hypothetical protein